MKYTYSNLNKYTYRNYPSVAQNPALKDPEESMGVKSERNLFTFCFVFLFYFLFSFTFLLFVLFFFSVNL